MCVCVLQESCLECTRAFTTVTAMTTTPRMLGKTCGDNETLWHSQLTAHSCWHSWAILCVCAVCACNAMQFIFYLMTRHMHSTHSIYLWATHRHIRHNTNNSSIRSIFILCSFATKTINTFDYTLYIILFMLHNIILLWIMLCALCAVWRQQHFIRSTIRHLLSVWRHQMPS